MSSIPTKQIDGDVAVGRNVSAGGDANVQGNVRVGHDLKIEGWLEAKNIKSANKGLFATAAALREAYPRPHDGWFAGVAASDKDIADLGLTVQQGKALFRMYVGTGGEWVCEPINKLYEIVVDNEQVDNLRDNLSTLRGQHENLAKRVDSHDTEIAGIKTQQTTLGNSINANTDNITTLKERADSHDTSISRNADAIKAITDTKGKAGGIAPLDTDGKVPAEHLPGFVDDVVEFNAMVEGAEVSAASVNKKSSDIGCMVVYDKDTNRFVLAVAILSLPEDIEWGGILRPERNSGTAIVADGSLTKGDFWNSAEGRTELTLSKFSFYSNWDDADRFGSASADGCIPEFGKIYTCTSENKTFRWSGSELEVIGSDLALGHTSGTAFPGEEGAQLQEDMEETNRQIANDSERIRNVGVLPFDGIYEEAIAGNTDTSKGVWLRKGSISDAHPYMYAKSWPRYGFEANDYNVLSQEDSPMAVRKDVVFRLGNNLYRVGDDDKLVGLAGSAVGNTFNATVEIPLPAGEYYSDIVAETQVHDVLRAVFDKGVASPGLQITFAIGPGSWKTYQYTGPNKTEAQFMLVENWIDLAGMSAGTEPVININYLCGDNDYTLSTAVQALIDYEKKSGIRYRKPGLVITYRRSSDPDVWETKQYFGNINDMTATNEAQWKDFGGGGNQVETTDTPEKDSIKAITSGGVYDALQEKPIVNFNDESDAENIKYQGVNEKGEPVGDPLVIPRSSGGGGNTGSTLNIYPETQAVWGAFGGRITLMAAIKSVSFDGDTEINGTIRTVAIRDALTRIVLWSELVNTPSSTSANDFKFEFDFTAFITQASSRDFIIEATDADGNTKSRTVTVTAVDVTVTCIQTLNYSSDTTLEVGGREKSLPMYKFENNVSTRLGILVTTEMYYNGAWRVLGTATITDQYSHNISIDPQNVFGGGEVLTHGAYPIRIQGKDLASGVVGNTVYTAVMCVDAASDEPLVSLRYNDLNNGKVRLYDNLTVDVAAYTPGKTTTPVEVVMDGKVITSMNCAISQAYQVTKQVQGYASDGTKSLHIYAQSGDVQTTSVTVTVEGSAIDASVKEGALFAFDFSTRSNGETNHEIADGGYKMLVQGCNWSSNGFVNVLGEQTLRIAENVRAEIPYAPFQSSALETSGMAVQLAFSTKSIKEKDAMLCECYNPAAGAGFYIKGNEIVLTVLNGTPRRQSVKFRCGEKVTVAFVVEPGSKYVTFHGADGGSGVNYSFVKMYVNGEETAAIGYQPGTSALRQSNTIKFNSENGDFNLNYIMAYNSHMEWFQAFRNYLCKLSDVDAMIAEFDKENVLDSTRKPSMSLMAAKRIPYYVIVADQTTFNNFDYALNGGTDTGDQFSCTLYYFNPDHPEVNFKAVNVLWRRQGTTSAQRPIKNDRFNFNKKNKATGLKATVTLLNPDDSTELGRKAILAARHNKVYVSEKGMFVDVVTVKVDYSDSSVANDCGVCNMMNATFRALGDSFLTPAQRAYNGTQDLGGGDMLTGLEMDHSTKNHPVACFRATTDTLQDAWFHAKGNWKEDKGEQVALGFKDTPGYNLGCLNYGDFVEYFGTPGETLAQTETRFKADTGTDTSKVYLISQYCGRDYAFYRYKGGAWVRSTGSMKQVDGQWQVVGDVLNPVSGYELLQYAGMDWWQGVSSVEDMMKPSAQISSWVRKLGLAATEYPAWTYYFECMIDDDQLQKDLALGKKVPYDLFNMLRFFDSCDYSKVDGWKDIWQKNAYRYLSLESAMAYTAFTDYLAAVDQRAKNMQPMFFLEEGCQVENGVYSGYRGMEPTRMYLNKVYDCDTCNGSDNDGGRDIDAETDPNKPTSETYANPYMGHGSVLFNNIDKQPEVWNSNDLGVTTISLKSVVNRMRTQTAVIDGKTMAPFSPDGALHFFVEGRLKFWPKVVTSYDCERKYIDNTGIANQPYFYALHGSGLTALPRFIEQRWAIRDGYYQCGDFFTNPLSGRVSAISADSKIYITAAATGYFGIGNDASGQLSETVYLEKGETHAFTRFAHDAGALLYIYQPGRMKKIDLSEISLDYHFDSLSKLELCEEVILGGEKHTENTPIPGFVPLGNIVMGDMPFLRIVDVSGTTAGSIDAKSCPRIERIIANDTALTTCSLAQTAPVETLTLPDTVTSLELVNLPKLTYPGGLTLGGYSSIRRLWVEGSPMLDVEKLIMAIADAGSISEVRMSGINMTASVSVLRSLYSSGCIGLDANGKAYEETGKCSGLEGRWILSELIDDDDMNGAAGLNGLKAYFPQLEIHNAQYSSIVFDDTENDTQNITNPDNGTSGESFAPSGHFLRIEKNSHAYKCTYNNSNPDDPYMEVEQVSDANYELLADGTEYDPQDNAGVGYDIMKRLKPYWYKGVNDFKNQKKHLFVSSLDSEPISTANVCRRYKLSGCLRQALACVYSNNLSDGDSYAVVDNPNHNCHEIDVEGMKQVRWPGVNNAQIGAVFVDDNDKVVGTFNMSVGNAMFDFVLGDYVFCPVPKGAKKFIFSSPAMSDAYDISTLEAIAVDSDAIEAIEPDWVHTQDRLVGVYAMSVDALMRPRSISGQRTKRGDGTSTTNADWKYDADGNVINASVPTSTMHFSWKDFMNLAEMRGKGFQCIDYELSKDIANIVFGLVGDRDIQAQCGYGCSSDHVTGASGANGFGNVTRRGTSTGSLGNITFGIQNFVACTLEWMDNVAVNVLSWARFKKDKCVSNTSHPIDVKWHIYDPTTKTERVVLGINSNNYCIGRVRFGRYADVIASRCTADTSKWNMNYSDSQSYSNDRCRVVGRAYYGALAYGGLVYSNASNVSSGAFTYFGSRLAFIGKIVEKKAA